MPRSPPDLTAPPAVQWRPTGEVPGPNRAAADPVAAGPDDPAFTPFSQDLPDLRREVALICSSARIGKRADALGPLVADLYRSGVDPAFAAEALIQGDCGAVAAVVRELVAQGGTEVAAAVVDRALSLSVPRAAGTIRAAAAEGLRRNPAALSPGAAGVPEAAPTTYAMAYVPSRGAAIGVVTDRVPKALYSHATPGYGVYTFVLPGGGFNPAKAADRARYAELLRVIETYVLAGEKGTRGPQAEAHAFLIAMRPGSADAKLTEQTGVEPSAAMRKDLVHYLKKHRQAALAERLERLPGPFLISSLEPRLLPAGETAPRLVSDLSGLGPEHLYAVVDAYDRPVLPQQQGQPEGLAPIRDRLLGIFSRQVPVQDPNPATKDAWVFRFGGPVAPPAEAPAATPGPTAPASVPADPAGAAAPTPTPSVSQPAPM